MVSAYAYPARAGCGASTGKKREGVMVTNSPRHYSEVVKIETYTGPRLPTPDV